MAGAIVGDAFNDVVIVAVLILGAAVWVKVWYNVVAATVTVWLTAWVFCDKATAIADAILANESIYLQK